MHPVLHAGEIKLRDCCPHSHPPLLALTEAWEALLHHRPALPQVDFPEHHSSQPGAVSTTSINA